ncbi:MAG: AbrB/MazE/SpoVT family DNA-binding domain-containing protein [Xanthobacteraceae bacterium]
MDRSSRMPATFSKVSVKSQIVIPREIRRRLALKPGDTLHYRLTEAGVLLEKAATNDIMIASLERAGLSTPSVVRPAKIACIEPNRIGRRIGRLDKASSRVVAQRPRSFLG